LDIYWNILTMHLRINVKSPNNISEWQMGFNSAFKGLTTLSSISQYIPSNGRKTVNNELDNIRINFLLAQTRTRHPKVESVLHTLQ